MRIGRRFSDATIGNHDSAVIGHNDSTDFARRNGGLNIMTILRDVAGETGGRNDPTSTLASPGLPREPRAPVAILSAARRNALIGCFNVSELTKRIGAWHGLPDVKPTSGVT